MTVKWPMIRIILITTFLISCSHQSARAPGSATELYPAPKSKIEDVHSRVNSEEFLAIKDARVAFANYELIRRDFPALAAHSNTEIDQWLLANAAYISRPNATTTAANSKIEVDSERRVNANRPPRYGRAAVFEARLEGEKIGLLDAKGIGHFLHARATPKGDGLASLGELLREVLFERLIALTLKDAQEERSVVGSYAIIDPGFNVKFVGGHQKPAGILVRQAHNRQTDHGFIAHPEERYKLERLFRRYGIMTHNNLQGTKDGDLFDFGHMYVDLNEGEAQLGPRNTNWGFDPEQLSNLQEVDQFSPSIIDGPSQAANELALKISQGEAGPEEIDSFFHEFLSEVKLPHLDSNSTCYQLLKGLL